MATLVLGTIGNLVGGPIGGAIGATLGRGIDSMIFGSSKHEGPRLKELAISTSSYGQPIPAIYGTVRAPGTVIWSTDLKEQRESNGGGKGKPKTTTYSYSVSLAVALSSSPIDRIGRIWADGNLLRGAADDLKTGGSMRSYTGLDDQQPDPLMAAALGAQCPAYRGCAYVVFEDLALEDFGNRIPALSFEIFAGSAAQMVGNIAADRGIDSRSTEFPQLGGFVHEGGEDASLLALLGRLSPMGAVTREGLLGIEGIAAPTAQVPTLPPPAAWDEGDFGREGGEALARKSLADNALSALRYYDASRDYQPGLQRTEGAADTAPRRVLEFPGVFSAADARSLLTRASTSDRQRSEALAWRMCELDPAIGPGSIVRAPGMSGLWRVTGWEWRERGVELELVRFVPPTSIHHAADPGTPWSPPDREGVESRLRIFELPWNGVGPSSSVQRYAALGAPSGRWPGASLYEVSGAALVPTGSNGGPRAVSGVLDRSLPPGNGLRFDGSAALGVRLQDEEAVLESASTTQLAQGANRLLVGGEVCQFAHAHELGNGLWELSGLLRARGGTEQAALTGHPAGTAVTLLDDRLIELPATSTAESFAAIGIADSEPVIASLEGVGRTRRPLFPVHPRAELAADGSLKLGWTRRARGGWAWLDEVEQPLVEQTEAYEVGLGPPSAPAALWQTGAAGLVLPSAEVSALVSSYPGAALWVRQCGSFAKSAPLHLTDLPHPL